MTDDRAGRHGSTTRAGFGVLAVAIRREPLIFTLSTLGSLIFGALTVADAWVLGWSTDHVVLPAFEDGHIDSDKPGSLPVLSGGGALGNGRMHGVPQMLECYLQLAGRAGERQREGMNIGVACHSSPHYGGAVVYSAEAF